MKFNTHNQPNVPVSAAAPAGVFGIGAAIDVAYRDVMCGAMGIDEQRID